MERINKISETADGRDIIPIHSFCGGEELTVKDISPYICIGCFDEERVDPVGGYTCHSCKFSVHKSCITIINPNDPTHSLSLVDGGRRAQCSVCRLSHFRYMYLCTFSNFLVCYNCVKKPLIIDPKRAHEHPLHIFLKGFFSFSCDACGVNDAKSCLCLCIPCRFTIHRDCVDLPRVICISFHDHRISHVPSLGPGNWFCRICRKKVDGMYGAYSCSKCSLVFHSRCATRDDVWDKIELEGVPEEDPAAIAPYTVVKEGVIKHFAHQHNLRLINEYDIVHDKNKQCSGCVLPIFSNTCYMCTLGCDFVLHETCANLLKKTRHPSRSRQLTLYAESIENRYEDDQGPFKCRLCEERCSGFAYVDGDFKIDVRCASVYDGYVHKSQPQSMLVVSENRFRGGLFTCSTCEKLYLDVWSVDGCDGLYMCYGCATIPQVVMHKYDVHPLSLRFGEKANGDYWCGICEKGLDSHKWFYTCDDCCTTLHIGCVQGKEPYMRVGSTFMFENMKLEVVLNKNNSRPHCRNCSSSRSRIEGAFVCNFQDDYFCSFWCLYGFAGLLSY